MAKNDIEQSARDKRNEELANSYSAACARLNFDTATEPLIQAKILIREGVKLLVKITDESNAIIESDYNEVKDILGLPMSKSQYKECVEVMSKILAGEYTDKNKERYAETVEQKRYDGMLRETFLEKVIDDGLYDFPIPTANPDKIGNVVRENLDAQNDKEFGEVFKRSVERIRNIKDLLQAEFNIYSDAFTYITQGLFAKRDYKKLVEWEYYEAGVPNENSAPRLWNDIYKAWETLRLAGVFRKGDFEDIANEFSMDVELGKPKPSDDHRSWWKKFHWDLFTTEDENNG